MDGRSSLLPTDADALVAATRQQCLVLVDQDLEPVQDAVGYEIGLQRHEQHVGGDARMLTGNPPHVLHSGSFSGQQSTQHLADTIFHGWSLEILMSSMAVDTCRKCCLVGLRKSLWFLQPPHV